MFIDPSIKAADGQRVIGREWWRGAVIYQIYPRSFRDANDDGVGDLRGITEKLDYVAGLGVDGVWLSPFFTSPMADFGYDVADYRDVDEVFGTLKDFDALVERAHGLGLRIIIDQVYCHTSDQHAWFRESRQDRTNDKHDWYVWTDPRPDGTPPNNWLSVFGGPAWSWDGRRKQHYLHHFLKQQPSLNLHNEDVISALIDTGKFWIDKGVDGFRLDALNMGMQDPELRDNPARRNSFAIDKPYEMQRHVNSINQPKMVGVVRQFADAFRAAGGEDFFTVAEIGGADPLQTMLTYTEGHDMLSSAYSFDFIGAMKVEPQHIRQTLGEWSNDLEQGYPGWAFSNHDCHRVASRWSLDGAPAGQTEKLFALMQSAMRGVLFIYQGEELGLPQADIPFDRLVDPEGIANWPADQGRDGARTPLPWEKDAPYAGFGTAEPWLPMDEAHPALSVAAQTDDPQSTLAFFREVIKLRRESGTLRFGDFEILETGSDLIAWARYDSDEQLTCVVNLTGEALPAPQRVDQNGKILAAVGISSDGPLPTDIPAFSGAMVLQAR
ncbi:MAG: alpha-glucosidase [Pseudomonadota bacterium]